MYQVTGQVIYLGHPFEVNEMYKTFRKLRLLLLYFFLICSITDDTISHLGPFEWLVTVPAATILERIG